MEILQRTRNHIRVKVDANEVIFGISDSFAALGYNRTQIVPLGVSTGTLQGSLGDMTTAQTQTDPGDWTWANVDVTGDAILTKENLYPYYRATSDAVVLFASLD